MVGFRFGIVGACALACACSLPANAVPCRSVVDGWGGGAHSSVSFWGPVPAGWQRQRQGTGVAGSRPLGGRARQHLGWPGSAVGRPARPATAGPDWMRCPPPWPDAAGLVSRSGGGCQASSVRVVQLWGGEYSLLPQLVFVGCLWPPPSGWRYHRVVGVRLRAGDDPS